MVDVNVLIAKLRQDSVEVLRESRRHRHFVGPSEARRLKSRRAQERARRTANTRWPVLVIRPLKPQEE